MSAVAATLQEASRPEAATSIEDLHLAEAVNRGSFDEGEWKRAEGRRPYREVAYGLRRNMAGVDTALFGLMGVVQVLRADQANRALAKECADVAYTPINGFYRECLERAQESLIDRAIDNLETVKGIFQEMSE